MLVFQYRSNINSRHLRGRRPRRVRGQNLLNELIDYLKRNFELESMKCECFLGLQVQRDKRNGFLKLLQSNYVERVLERFKMTECRSTSTPEEVGNVAPGPDDQPLTEDFPFEEIIGSLLYLVTCSRPDIAHAVGVASRRTKK